MLMSLVRAVYCILYSAYSVEDASMAVVRARSALALASMVTGFMLQTFVLITWKHIVYFDMATAHLTLGQKLRVPMVLSSLVILAVALTLYAVLFTVTDLDTLDTVFKTGAVVFGAACLGHSALFAFFAVRMGQTIAGAGGSSSSGKKTKTQVMARKVFTTGLGIAGFQLVSVAVWVSVLFVEASALNALTAVTLVADLVVALLFLVLYQPTKHGVLSLLRSKATGPASTKLVSAKHTTSSHA